MPSCVRSGRLESCGSFLLTCTNFRSGAGPRTNRAQERNVVREILPDSSIRLHGRDPQIAL